MAKFIQTSFNAGNLTTLKSVIDGLQDPKFSVTANASECTIVINGVATLYYYNTDQFRQRVTFNGQTLTYNYLYVENKTVTICNSDTLFYMLIMSANGQWFQVLYEKIDDVDYVGSTRTDYLRDLVLYNISTLNQYRHGILLNYTTPANSVDFLDHSKLVVNGTTLATIADTNFRSCTTVAERSVITVAGINYYAAGANFLIELEE
jgi:hypothetical protein